MLWRRSEYILNTEGGSEYVSGIVNYFRKKLFDWVLDTSLT